MIRLIPLLVLHLSVLLMADSAVTSGKSDLVKSKSALLNKTLIASDIVTAAKAFKNTLSNSQITTLQKNFTNTLAQNWSNLPCGSGCRNGIQFSMLTSLQLEAALAVIELAAGAAANEGYAEFSQIRLADDYLSSKSSQSGGGDEPDKPGGPGPGRPGPGGPGPGGPGGGGYSSGIYYISFLNEPSVTGSWMLQYGGHHYAANIAFKNGQVVGVTPIFEGVEPTSFTISGTTYSPITQEHKAMVDMLSSLDGAQLEAAKLSASFSDVLLGPGNDGSFPSKKAGLKVGTLSQTQKNLVLAAMEPWLNDVNEKSAATLLEIYKRDLDNTYISFTGNGIAKTADSFLNANADYVRIDGPGVWIEFVCQSGIMIRNQIHYHTVWRDRLRDYGNYLSNETLAL